MIQIDLAIDKHALTLTIHLPDLDEGECPIETPGKIVDFGSRGSGVGRGHFDCKYFESSVELFCFILD